MKKLRYSVYLAIVLALDIFLAYSGLVNKQVSPAYAAALVYNSSDAISDVSSPKITLSPETTPSPEATLPFSVSYPTQRWGISKIDAPKAWQISGDDQSIIVAVLDTGIDKNSQDLAGRLVAEVNFTDSTTNNDVYGHGTHTASTIAVVAPGCKLMNVKVADDAGRCEPLVVARGIIWAVDHKASIINVSLCMESSPDLEKAVNYAWEQGVVVVAAAGNRGKSQPVYPAYYVSCIAVAATNEGDSLALLSNHGDWVDVAAPGSDTYSELPDNQYGYKSGTSSAAAHVSGVAALVFSVAIDTNGNGVINDEVRQAIENSCSPIGATGVGKGRINALKAVTETLSPSRPSPDK